MNLQQLNNTIHNSTKTEFISQRTSWVSSITSELASASEADIEYFRNHTGRELIRKANLFGDTAFIKDDFDDGFRPKRVDPTTGLNGNIISWYDAADPSSHDLDSEKRVIKAYDKAGSFDLSTSAAKEKTPTIDTVKFNDGRLRKTFFFQRGAGPNNCMFRSYDYSHNFTSDGELNMLIVLHHLPSNLGDSDPQDFIFEAAQNGNHAAGTPRFFFRKSGEDSASPSYNSSGMGGGSPPTAIRLNEADAGQQLDNPVNLLLNLHISNGSQVLRFNGKEIHTSSKASMQNITDEAGGGGGIIWGGNIYGQHTLEGGFGEIILYDDFTGDGEFLESYLAKKWGFDVPTPKHFKTFV